MWKEGDLTIRYTNPIVPITDLVTIYNGKDAKRSETPTETFKVPFYNIGGIEGYVEKSICDEPCIAIGAAGTIGKPRLLEPPYWVGGTQIYLVAQPGINIWFVYEVLHTVNWKYFTNPYAIPPKIEMSEFRELEIECPGNNEDMNKIGGAFKNYLRELELTKKLIDSTDHIKHILFYVMFGDLNMYEKNCNDFKNKKYKLA